MIDEQAGDEYMGLSWLADILTRCANLDDKIALALHETVFTIA